MIQLQTKEHLNIIMPNKNQALKTVLENATKTELEVLTKGKDLKSVVNDLLQQSSKNETSNKELLDAVKNNPTLKSLGNSSKTITDITKKLDSDPSTKELATKLKSFASDIKDIKPSQLKEKFENSGIFLESKLKNVTNPKVDLKKTLTSLVQNLKPTNDNQVKSIINDTIKIIKSDTLNLASNGDVVKNKTDNQKTLTTLLNDVKDVVSKLEDKLKLPREDNLKETTKDIKNIKTLETKTITDNNFKNLGIEQDLKSQVSKISVEVKNFQQIPKTESLKDIDKLFSEENKLKLPKENETKNLKDLNKFEKTEQKEPIYSKQTQSILKDLKTLQSPLNLKLDKNIKDIVDNDLKSQVSKLSTEVKNSQHPQKAEILKDIDKLSLELDYHQLMSHLSNNTLLYIPFNWDALQKGEIDIKNAKDDKFFCDINLTLKDYGELNLKLTLYEENQLNLHFYSDSIELKDILKENLSDLRSALIDTKITPREIRIKEKLNNKMTNSPYQSIDDNIKLGFEIKA